jgi:hypothetical protein
MNVVLENDKSRRNKRLLKVQEGLNTSSEIGERPRKTQKVECLNDLIGKFAKNTKEPNVISYISFVAICSFFEISCAVT